MTAEGRCYFSPIGYFMCCFRRTDGKYFLVLYAIIAYFFSLKMVRRRACLPESPPGLRVDSVSPSRSCLTLSPLSLAAQGDAWAARRRG